MSGSRRGFDPKNDARKRMRAAIIANLATIGYVKKDNTPDYERINKFIQEIGENNPRKVILNFLYLDELPAVVTQVKEMVKKESRRMSGK